MDLRGCYVAIVTPFNNDGSINESALRDHIEFLISKGVSGVVPCGTTGESATLSWEEHNLVVDLVIDQAKGRIQVIAGAGSNNTAESIAAAQHAQQKGANAILCITPYYNKPTQEGLFQHYRAVASKVDIPIVVYNVPGRTGVNLTPETLERLCEFDNIIAVKEASGDVTQISEIHRRCGDRISILSGDDSLTLPILSVGGKGVISVVANLIPDRMCAMINSFFQNDFGTALKIHEEMLPLCKAMFIETNPIPVKTAVNLMGMHGGPFRLPLVEMSEHNKSKLITVLRNYNLYTGN
ncbi:MAG: 4-hydroxy-tetrahydrodipicolinate synthase [Fibrobacter sp.]|nr:4-hydroxy-tetrahydrodipicolinate synthase [Fibrobacter sp.]